MPSGAVLVFTSAVEYDAPRHRMVNTQRNLPVQYRTMLPAIRCPPSESYMITIGIGIVGQYYRTVFYPMDCKRAYSHRLWCELLPFESLLMTLPNISLNLVLTFRTRVLTN